MCDNCGACDICDLKRSLKATNILDTDIGKPDIMTPTYKLTYFPITGLAEPIRFLLKYGGIEFEDFRFERENWPSIKANMPFGQVPVLEVDGKKAHQSVSIARYIAKQVKLVGKDDWEDLEIDSVVDTINDIRMKLALYFYETDVAVKESRKEPLFKESLPYYLERLNTLAKENDGHLAVSKLTWADLYFTALVDTLNHYSGIDVLDDYPNLQAVKEKVFDLPPIKEWIAMRPQTDF